GQSNRCGGGKSNGICCTCKILIYKGKNARLRTVSLPLCEPQIRLTRMNEPSSKFAASDPAAGREGRSIFVAAPDGLRLHVREYGPPDASFIPVVCLPGLARTTADFAVLAPALAYGEPARRVVAIDS